MDRLTAEMGLQHPYMSPYSCPEDEPTSQHPFRIEDTSPLLPTDTHIHSFGDNFHGLGNCRDHLCYVAMEAALICRVK